MTLGELMTVLLDLPVSVGMARCVARGALARFEAKGQVYHERVREGFLALAAREPDRFVVVDAALDEEAVAAAVWHAVAARFGLPAP